VPAKLKMHDLVHDLAMFVVDDDLVVISGENSECAFERPRYALLVACENLNLLKDLPTPLRALRIIDSPLLKIKWYNSSFVKFLRVLDISGTCIEKLPSSIGKLMQLRYLNASGIQSEELPKAIGSLSELRYLNFHGSSISALPESASKLGRLLHLDLSACMNLQMLPRSFCDLKCLSLLNLENCSLLSSLPDDLGKLKNLDKLKLSGCTCLDMLPESLGELESLRQLDLSGCKKLSMLPHSYCELTKLKYLNIARCSDLDIPVDTLNKLISLEYVNMSSCPKLLGLPQEFCNLEHLHTLNLSDCSNLKKLPERLGQMQSLRFISLDGCAESVRRPVLQHGLGAGLQSLPAFVIETEIKNIRSNISELEQEKFSELELYRLENVRTVDEAEALKLSNRSELRSLGLMWTLNINRFVSDEALLRTLEPPKLLKKLRVHGYMGERFPKWNVEIGSHHRVQLDEVQFMHFPMCNSLPHLGRLANLKKLHLSRMPKIRIVGTELCDHTGSLKKLEILTLEYMENLVEWNTILPSASGLENHQEFMFPALQELNIYHCPQLVMQPCPPRSPKWEVRESNKPAQLLLNRDEVMQSLADYMGLRCPFGYTTELHASGSCKSSPDVTYGWKFHGSLIALNDLICDSCSLIDMLLGKGSSLQCLVNLEISGVEDTKSSNLQEQVDTVAYSTRSSLAKSWPDWFSQPVGIKNGVSPHFLLTGYASCLLQGWIDEITSFLGNLIRINMDELPLCDRLPPLGHLPRLQELRLKGMPKIRRIDRDFCGSDRSSSSSFFPRLTMFVLNGMRNLEEWATKVPITGDHCGQEEFMFPALVNLTIWNCPMLKLKPCPPRARKWDINNSDKVIASSYDISTTDELATTLQVLLTKVPPNGWSLLRHLPRIENLAIVSCHSIEALPDNIRTLSSLQFLTISKCQKLKHLPEWLGDLTSLEKLMVVRCPMESLPGSLRRLTSLRSLSLCCCDRLTALPGCFSDVNSLEKLTIEGCKSLKSLPQLYMLENLLVKYNGELEKWCESEVNKTKFAKIKREVCSLQSTFTDFIFPICSSI
jgi:Leucine-rich repeat (LRR) protein